MAWHAATKKLYLLEFTWAMDHKLNLDEAVKRKGQQYSKAVTAFRLHQRTVNWRNRIKIETLPFIYGVPGSVMEEECAKHLGTVGVANCKHVQTILTRGVRAAVQALYNMKLARSAALDLLHSEQAAANALRAAEKKKTVKAPTRTRKGAAGAQKRK